MTSLMKISKSDSSATGTIWAVTAHRALHWVASLQTKPMTGPDPVNPWLNRHSEPFQRIALHYLDISSSLSGYHSGARGFMRPEVYDAQGLSSETEVLGCLDRIAGL